MLDEALTPVVISAVAAAATSGFPSVAEQPSGRPGPGQLCRTPEAMHDCFHSSTE